MTLLSQCAVVTEKTIGGITTFKQQLQQESIPVGFVLSAC